MSKKTFYSVLVLLALPALGFSKESQPPAPEAKAPSADLRPRLMDETFVIETSEADLDESLNRISGPGDRGYASEEYTYKSENHGKAGPFARQDAVDKAESHGGY